MNKKHFFKFTLLVFVAFIMLLSISVIGSATNEVPDSYESDAKSNDTVNNSLHTGEKNEDALV